VFSFLTQSRLERHDWNCFWHNCRSLSRRSLGEERVDIFHFPIREAQIASAHDPLGLTRVASADDGSGDGWIMQCPGDCDFSG
jgi:hypothetical protein